MVQYKDKFIAFIDVLGFTNLVERSATGTSVSPSTIAQIQEALSLPGGREELDQYGPTICPDSPRVERNLDFRLTSLSDSVLISCEISPAGVVNLLSRASAIVCRLLKIGVMCRGYITRGPLVHSDNNFFGPGYQEALGKEKMVSVFRRSANEVGTPFVELSKDVCAYVHDCRNACAEEMFSRLTTTAGDTAVLFPIKRLSHAFIVGGYGTNLSTDRERQSNENVRGMIHKFKTGLLSFVDRSNPKAVSKVEHYIEALNDQLNVCDQIEKFLKEQEEPFSS